MPMVLFDRFYFWDKCMKQKIANKLMIIQLVLGSWITKQFYVVDFCIDYGICHLVISDTGSSCTCDEILLFVKLWMMWIGDLKTEVHDLCTALRQLLGHAPLG